MKKLLTLAFVTLVMMLGTATAQESKNCAGLALHGWSTFGNRCPFISNYEIQYEYQFASGWGIAAALHAEQHFQLYCLTGRYHYNFWNGFSVVGGFGWYVAHWRDDFVSFREQTEPLPTAVSGPRLELGLEYDFARLPLRLAVGTCGSSEFHCHKENPIYFTSFLFAPAFSVAYRF